MLRSVLLTSLLVLGSPVALSAQNASLTVLHGIPDLPSPVEVFANGGRLFAFDFGAARGPLSLPPGSYFVEVKLDGMTVLSANADLAAGGNYSAVAHLQVGSGIQLSLFENDVSAPAAGNSRLTVRHLADAPAVDIGLDQGSTRIATIPGLTNPMEFTAEVPAGSYTATIFPAMSMQPAFGPVPLDLTEGKAYIVYAIGSLSGGSFRVFPQVQPDPTLTLSVSGVSCGGNIGASSLTPSFGSRFDVQLSGALPSVHALLFIGTSDTTIHGAPLPVSLDRFGATGCSVYTNSIIAIGTMTDSSGAASITVPTPDPAVGLLVPETYHQWGHFAPGANPLDFLFTDYATLGVDG